MIAEMFGKLPPCGRFWLYLGLVTLAAAAGMSLAFGREISWLHAAFLACMSAIAAFLPHVAYEQWEGGKRKTSVTLAIMAIPLFAIEFYTHAGYTAGLRGRNIETATVQNARYDSRQDEVREGKASLELWAKRLADLEREHAWAATVTADALRAQLSTADEAIRQEERRGGCGPKCLGLKKDKAALEARIALAEEKSTLTTRIEAARKVLAASREKAVTTEHQSSAVAHQNAFLSRVVSLAAHGSLEPTAFVGEAAQQSVNLAMALAGTGLPALALFIAGLYRREDDNHDKRDVADVASQPVVQLRVRTIAQARAAA